MSLPRSLRLKKTGKTWVLLEQPVKSLQALRGTPTEWTDKKVSGEITFPASGQVLELEADFIPAQGATCGVKLAADNSQFFTIGYDAANEKLFIDRSKSGNTTFDNAFSNWLNKAIRVPLQDGKLHLHIFFDKSIIEVFANDGGSVLTAQLFPDSSHGDIVFFSENGTTRLTSVKEWPLSSAWK
jgi:fructan beta-fructosidase